MDDGILYVWAGAGPGQPSEVPGDLKVIIVISDQSFAGLSENPTFDNPLGETFGLHGLVVFEF